MVCLHVLLRVPTEWLVRSDHHARRVHDLLDRCDRPDVGRSRGTPASIIEEKHATAVDQHGLVARRYRHLPSVGNIATDIDERHQACHRSHVHIVAARTRRARGAFRKPIGHRAVEAKVPISR